MKYIITTSYGSLFSYFSYFITPDVNFSYLLRHAQFSRACCLKKSCISSGIFWKNSAGSEKSHGKHIQFLFWFIALCNYNNQRALMCRYSSTSWFISCYSEKVVTPSCSLLIVVPLQYLYVCACKHFIVQTWHIWGNECWCLQSRGKQI